MVVVLVIISMIMAGCTTDPTRDANADQMRKDAAEYQHTPCGMCYQENWSFCETHTDRLHLSMCFEVVCAGVC
jgi:cytidine deaminase